MARGVAVMKGATMILGLLCVASLACIGGPSRRSSTAPAQAQRSGAIVSVASSIDGGEAQMCPVGKIWMGAHCFVPCTSDSQCPPQTACVCRSRRCYYTYVSTEARDKQPLENVCVPIIPEVDADDS